MLGVLNEERLATRENTERKQARAAGEGEEEEEEVEEVTVTHEYAHDEPFFSDSFRRRSR